MNKNQIIKAMNKVGELPSLEDIQRREMLLKKTVLERVLTHLLNHPGNYYEAGVAAGISREEVMKLRSEHIQEFKDNENRFYDSLAEDLLTYARYGFVKDKPDFDPNTAKMVLERRTADWTVTKKMSVDSEMSMGDVGSSKIVDEFFSKLDSERTVNQTETEDEN